MGQYHQVANIDKKEYINPHKLGLGLKQAEQLGAMDASMGNIIYLLIAGSIDRGGGDPPSDGLENILGRWAGDRVVVCGDYSTFGDYNLTRQEFDSMMSGLWSEENDGWEEISNKVIPLIKKLWGIRLEGDGWAHRAKMDGHYYLRW